MILILAVIALIYAGLAISAIWVLELTCPKHPIKNTIIAAIIPGIFMILFGLIIDFPKNGWTMVLSNKGWLFSLITIFALALFVCIGLPICAIFRRKFAKTNAEKRIG